MVRAAFYLHMEYAQVNAGPYPDLKFPTLISRVTQAGIQPSLLFFRTSTVSRSTPRFLHETTMLPPLMYDACVQTLYQIAQKIRADNGTTGVLQLHFADEEGDPYAVELAARLGGYVVGKDSDFVILNADGYAGYITLDEMVWTALSQSEVTSPIDNGDDDGFQTVVNSKAKKKAASRAGVGYGILPPEEPLDLQLTVTTYAPLVLASHLQIPPSLLPLVGALVGNDFTGNKDPSSVSTAQQINLQWLFFERQLTLSQRITRVANTLRTILSAALTPNAKGKQKQQVRSVMELIERAVSALMIRSLDSMGSGERERVVNRVVDATLQYAIPRYDGDVNGAEGLWTSGVCALHSADSCPLLRYMMQPVDAEGEVDAAEELPSEYQERVRALYIAAYRAGRLDPHTLDPMRTGTFWYRQFLENPDLEAVARSMARPIQLWCYALLDDSLGLPERPELEKVGVDAEDNVDGTDAGEDEDELIDVVEEESDEEEQDNDPLAPLRGALQQLNTSKSNVSADPHAETAPSVSSHARSTRQTRPKIVVEYVRRGSRLAEEEVVVPSMEALRSTIGFDIHAEREDDPILIQLLPLEDRVNFLLRVLDSDHPLIKSLPTEQRIVALTLRWVVSRLYTRAQESGGNKDREKERWTKQEARAFLASFSWHSPQNPEVEDESVPVVNRNVQLVAQVLTTMDALERLSQVLLVDEQFPSSTLRFSGRLFHAYLTGTKQIPAQAVPDRLWHASTEHLEHAFIEPSGKKRKKDRKRGVEANGPVLPGGAPATSKTNGVAVGGKFGLLAALDP